MQSSFFQGFSSVSKDLLRERQLVSVPQWYNPITNHTVPEPLTFQGDRVSITFHTASVSWQCSNCRVSRSEILYGDYQDLRKHGAKHTDFCQVGNKLYCAVISNF